MMRELPKLVIVKMLSVYRYAISPMFPPSCRFVPTCSEYAMEAVDRFGVLRGGLMACWRLMRCQPLARGGYDPVTRHACAHESHTGPAEARGITV
jgi:uncharacterized protein